MKTIVKSKERAYTGLKVRFDLNYYPVSGNFKEEKDNGSTTTKSTQDATILFTYVCEGMKNRIKVFDLRNACLVRTLKDKNGGKSVERWDFGTCRHLLDHYGSITKEEILMWCNYCLR